MMERYMYSSGGAWGENWNSRTLVNLSVLELGLRCFALLGYANPSGLFNDKTVLRKRPSSTGCRDPYISVPSGAPSLFSLSKL